MAPRAVHVGCSGWAYRDWRGILYEEGLPQRRWLERYSRTFETVEVNNTFYRLPSRDAVAGWAEQTPARFEFTVKGSRYLTHIKRLAWPDQSVSRFYERLEPLVEAKKLGPTLWQLPENFQRDDERLAGALDQLEAGRHCFEFRHPSWFCEEVYALLRSHRAALVIGDHPDRPFQTQELTTSWTLIRLHRGHRGRGGNYSDREIEDWASRIGELRRRATVYAYFNNDWRGLAVKNAMRLREALASQV
jgi:uncharacterized protein YecE (DUF72 family)